METRIRPVSLKDVLKRNPEPITVGRIIDGIVEWGFGRGVITSPEGQERVVQELSKLPNTNVLYLAIRIMDEDEGKRFNRF